MIDFLLVYKKEKFMLFIISCVYKEIYNYQCTNAILA